MIGFQLGGLQHAIRRLHGFDVVDQPGPTVEAVLARQCVLRRRQRHRGIGGAKRIEIFLGLLAELLERRTVGQTTLRRGRAYDLLSNSARVRSTG